MAFVNVGASVNGERPLTKKALREALRDNPESVYFDSTALMGPRAGEIVMATPRDIGVDKLSVVGPDPYTRRTWYATVSVINGAVKMT